MPVENQVRELDARLLLACVAAKRGLTVHNRAQTEDGVAYCLISEGHIPL